MANLNSSAGRLYEILVALKKNAQSSNDELRVVLARTFNVKAGDYAQLLEIYLELINLVIEAKGDVEKVGDIDKGLYMEPFSQLEKGFSSNSLIHGWANFSKYLDDTTMKSLQFCADTLSRRVGEQPIPAEDLAELQKEVDDLLEHLMKADVDEILKKFLIERLDQIRRAILYYRLNGGQGLKDVLEKIIGSSLIFGRNNAEKDFNEKAKELWQKFGVVVVKLAFMVELANNLKGLTGFSFPKLPGMP